MKTPVPTNCSENEALDLSRDDVSTKRFDLPPDSFKKFIQYRQLAQQTICLQHRIQLFGFAFVSGKKKLRQMKKIYKSMVRRIRRAGYYDLLQEELSTMA